MFQEELLEELRAEASCPMCLDILTDPVTLECGHHCCASCLRACWQDLPDILPCPVCQHHCAHKRLQKNIQMSYLTDLLKQLPGMESKEKQKKEQPLCEQHMEVLSLFCEKDLNLVCAECRVSCEHQGHPLIPIQEAAAEHRKKLKSHLWTLKKQLEETEKLVRMLIKQRQEFKEKINSQRILIHREVENYKTFLRLSQHLHNRKLEREILQVSKESTRYAEQLSSYGSSLNSLLNGFTQLCLQTDIGFLKMMPVYQHLENWYKLLHIPQTCSYTFNENLTFLPSQYLGLHDIRKFYVDLTLDPETAHHSLLITEDKKTILFDRNDMISSNTDPAFTAHLAVMGSESFDSGRHFWMVEIRGSGVFSLGVCRESFPCDDGSLPTEGNGCWKIEQPIGTDHNMHIRNMMIGIFLDYELGDIWFYDMHKMTPICTVTANFTEKLTPCFAIERSSLSGDITLR